VRRRGRLGGEGKGARVKGGGGDVGGGIQHTRAGIRAQGSLFVGSPLRGARVAFGLSAVVARLSERERTGGGQRGREID